MSLIYFLSHPEVDINPQQDITTWSLSKISRKRMRTFLLQPWMMNVNKIYSSPEQKAQETAEILTAFLEIPYQTLRGLEEIDRSSTGYLPEKEFYDQVSKFFSHPNESINGWEKAVVAQERIVTAINTIIEESDDDSHILIASHGGVGALLLAHLSGQPISQDFDQPSQGHFFAFDSSFQLLHSWKSIDTMTSTTDYATR